jgi:hypothetical protein
MDAKLDIEVLAETIKAFALTQIAQHMEKVKENIQRCMPMPLSQQSIKYKEDSDYADKVRTAARERFPQVEQRET